jgi:hypothetical protein
MCWCCCRAAVLGQQEGCWTAAAAIVVISAPAACGSQLWLAPTPSFLQPPLLPYTAAAAVQALEYLLVRGSGTAVQLGSSNDMRLLLQQLSTLKAIGAGGADCGQNVRLRWGKRSCRSHTGDAGSVRCDMLMTVKALLQF